MLYYTFIGEKCLSNFVKTGFWGMASGKRSDFLPENPAAARP
jgi:hypothetical protein